jgi:hypothetical protein
MGSRPGSGHPRRHLIVVASLRRSAAVSILFTIFGGPGWVLVYLPYWITRFRVSAGEPWWQTLLGGR